MKIGVGYRRMSTDNQQESPKMQKNDIEEYAVKNDIKIIKWYEDLGISGGSLKKRKGMMELIFDAEKKLFDVVVFWKYDRVFRNIEEQSVVLNKFETLGIEYTGIKDVEGEGASGRLIRNILGSINQFERELTGERIFYSNRHRAKNGYWSGGVIPLGYDLNSETKTFIVNEKDAKLVNLIKDLYLQHRSCYKVAQKLNVMGRVSKAGRKFSGVTISTILRNPTYAGKIRWNLKGKAQGKMEVFEGQHEAIWTLDEYNEIQSILDKNINNEYGNRKSYLLSGLLICSDCGYKIKALTSGRKKTYYRCNSRHEFGKDFCNNNESVSAMLLHPIVLNKLKNNIAGAKLQFDKPPLKKTEKTNKESEIKRLEGLIEKYKNLYLMNLVGENELKENINNYKNQVEKLKLNEDRSEVDESIIEMLSNFDFLYNKANHQEKKDLVHLLIDKIVFYSKLHYVIKYKNLGIEDWKLQDKIIIETKKKSISKEEIDIILSNHLE